jgi:hypothetical protein
MSIALAALSAFAATWGDRPIGIAVDGTANVGQLVTLGIEGAVTVVRGDGLRRRIRTVPDGDKTAAAHLTRFLVRQGVAVGCRYDQASKMFVLRTSSATSKSPKPVFSGKSPSLD